jgi:hypothetical protein
LLSFLCIPAVVGSYAVAAIIAVPCCWRHCFAYVMDIACVTAVAYKPAVGGIPAVAGVPLVTWRSHCSERAGFTSQKLMSRGHINCENYN